MIPVLEYIPSQMRHLAETLNAADREYYVRHRSPMTDFEYDERMRLLQSMEKEYPMYADPQSPTHRVGSDLGIGEDRVGERARIRHLVPMLSVANVTNKADLLQWMLRKKKETDGNACFMLEKKYDGISVSLIYRKGVLCSASTRGDGMEGNDITANVMQIAGLPRMLPADGGDYRSAGVPEELELRGEIILPDDAFERINSLAAGCGGTVYQTQRNAVSAMTMTDDPVTYSRRGIEIRIYQMIGGELPDSNSIRLSLMESWGVPGSAADMVFSDPHCLLQALDDHENLRSFCGFATDGMVVKIDQNSLRCDERNTARHYDWAIAYKWRPTGEETSLVSVKFDIGRTGQLNASALIVPVMIDGRCVTTVGLNSIKRLRELDLHYGDCIRVEMAGDCTPYLSSVDVSRREPDAGKVRIPERCPYCGSPLEWKGERLFCSDEECTQRVAKQMLYVARSTGIKGVTASVVEKLVDNGVRCTTALLDYDEDMLCLFGVGKATARKIVGQAEMARKKGKVKVIYS